MLIKHIFLGVSNLNLFLGWLIFTCINRQPWVDWWWLSPILKPKNLWFIDLGPPIKLNISHGLVLFCLPLFLSVLGRPHLNLFVYLLDLFFDGNQRRVLFLSVVVVKLSLVPSLYTGLILLNLELINIFMFLILLDCTEVVLSFIFDALYEAWVKEFVSSFMDERWSFSLFPYMNLFPRLPLGISRSNLGWFRRLY